MKTLKEGFLAIGLTCLVYLNTVRGQIVKNGSNSCKQGVLSIEDYTWQELIINQLKTACLQSCVNISGNTIKSVPSGAFREVSGTEFKFEFNSGPEENNKKIEFNADFSVTNFTRIVINNNNKDGGRIIFGKTVSFNSNTELIRLNSNNIKHLPNTIFRNLKQMNKLFLYGNKLRTLKSNVFYHLKGLLNLDIANNEIKALPHGIFQTLSMLKELDLSRNSISCLESDIFEGLSKIETLIIRSNKLSYILPNTFKLKSLRDLDLAKNNLRTISGDQFLFWEDAGHILPNISVVGNTLTHLPRCLTKLANFNYKKRKSITKTERIEPKNKAAQDICKRTKPYDYPADTCKAWKIFKAGGSKPSTPAPDKPKPNSKIPFFLGIVLLLVLVTLLVVLAAKKIAEYMELRNASREFDNMKMRYQDHPSQEEENYGIIEDGVNSQNIRPTGSGKKRQDAFKTDASTSRKNQGNKKTFASRRSDGLSLGSGLRSRPASSKSAKGGKSTSHEIQGLSRPGLTSRSGGLSLGSGLRSRPRSLKSVKSSKKLTTLKIQGGSKPDVAGRSRDLSLKGISFKSAKSGQRSGPKARKSIIKNGNTTLNGKKITRNASGKVKSTKILGNKTIKRSK